MQKSSRRRVLGIGVALGGGLLAAETEPLAAVLEMEAVHQARTAMTEDHLEASRAFAEKRRPVVKGEVIARPVPRTPSPTHPFGLGPPAPP